MKRIALALIVALSLGTAASAITNQYDTSISASETNTAVSFGFAATYVWLKNDDATNEVYLDFSDTTAATSNFELKAGESISIDFRGMLGGSITGLGAICASSETATIRVLAIN